MTRKKFFWSQYEMFSKAHSNIIFKTHFVYSAADTRNLVKKTVNIEHQFTLFILKLSSIGWPVI